jgi:hypothetical protein
MAQVDCMYAPAEAQRLRDAHAHRVEKQAQEIEDCKREIEILGAAALERDEIFSKHQALEAEAQQLRSRLQQLEAHQREKDAKSNRMNTLLSFCGKVTVVLAITAVTTALLSICAEEAHSSAVVGGTQQQPSHSMWEKFLRWGGGNRSVADGVVQPPEKPKMLGVCKFLGLGGNGGSGEYVQAGMLVATGIVIGTTLCHLVR